MTDVYVVGIDMIKFGRFPERTVPELGAQAALMALDDCGPDHPGHAGALLRQPRSRPSGMVGQRILREIGQTGIPVVNIANACATGATAFREGWMAIKAGVYDVVLASASSRWARGLLGGAAAARASPTEGLLGSGTMPRVFAEVGMEHTPQVRHDVRAVRQGVGEEPPPLHAQPQGHVPEGDAARGGDGRGDDRLSQHQADVLGERRRLGRRGAVLGEEGQGARPDEARGAGAGLGADQRSLHAARPRDGGLQHRDALRRQDGLRDGRRSARTTSIWSSCTTASPPPSSSTTRTSACAPTARRGRLIDSGETALGGRIPVNVSGGLLSKGHPLGATGIANIYEIDDAPARRGRQPPGRRRAHRADARGRRGQRLRGPHPREGLRRIQ